MGKYLSLKRAEKHTIAKCAVFQGAGESTVGKVKLPNRGMPVMKRQRMFLMM